VRRFVTVACAQVEPVVLDREATIDRLADLTAEAAGNGAQLVEVLPEAGYDDEHLPGAISIPLKTLDAESARRLEPQLPVIVYCHDYQ